MVGPPTTGHRQLVIGGPLSIGIAGHVAEPTGVNRGSPLF
jgi:hypothetical protein